MSIERVAREIIPPILWQGASQLRKVVRKSLGKRRRFKYGVEQPADYYDAAFDEAEHWKQHYTASHYYPLWTVIVDRVRRCEAKSILDIGCGPGQVACLLRDVGVEKYVGLDFSPKRVDRARRTCSEFKFVSADVFQNDSLEKLDYDCVLMMEFLEHVERDLEVLRRVRQGAELLGTVPNFAARGHVRHFANEAEVRQRYEPMFRELDVTPVLANDRGNTYYLLQATR
jgi:SAM-dependent methyltransferase